MRRSATSKAAAGRNILVFRCEKASFWGHRRLDRSVQIVFAGNVSDDTFYFLFQSVSFCSTERWPGRFRENGRRFFAASFRGKQVFAAGDIFLYCGGAK